MNRLLEYVKLLEIFGDDTEKREEILSYMKKEMEEFNDVKWN